MKKETYMKILDSALLREEERQSLCALDTIMRIDDETYACEKCALVDTISRNAGCSLTIKENLKGVK